MDNNYTSYFSVHVPIQVYRLHKHETSWAFFRLELPEEGKKEETSSCACNPCSLSHYFQTMSLDNILATCIEVAIS